MKQLKESLALGALVFSLFASTTILAQEKATILTGAELTRVVPAGFYFQGLTAQTQMRNAAAAKFGNTQHVIAGLVDTAGYAADVRAKYEGFLICDTAIVVNGESLPIGAYGFGFSNDGKMIVMDLSGKDVWSVSSANDKSLKRPRPLMMTTDPEGIRMYSGRDYVVITVK
jgi:hypothetical protein